MMASGNVKVAFRVDASNSIGTGHVMRSLTLANALREQGAEVVFICRAHEGHLCSLIEERGFGARLLPPPREGWAPAEGQPDHAAWIGADWQDDAEETLTRLEGFHPDWLVVDHYGLDARWEGRLRASIGRIMVIDDLADRTHDCDVLLDQNLVASQDERYRGKLPKDAILLLGPAYALLQPDYARLRSDAVVREGPVRRLLVSFGGVDEPGLTLKTAKAVLSIDRPEIEADIVLSASSPDFAVIRDRIADRPSLRLHSRLPSLAPLMGKADLAVGGSGTSSWERLCLGLPSLVVTLAQNQRPIADALSRRGLVRWLGDADEVDEAAIRNALEEAIEAGLDGAWSRRCFDVVDGQGVERVCAVILAHRDMPLVIRPAELHDEAILLDWANDPDTRRNAFNPKPISSEEHQRWFRSRLRRQQDCAFYMAETETGVPLGQVRFDRGEGEWEISYSVAPCFRGRGLGCGILRAAISQFRQARSQVSLVGQVKSENMASRKIFESLGFVVSRAGPDRYVYTLDFRE